MSKTEKFRDSAETLPRRDDGDGEMDQPVELKIELEKAVN